MKLSPVKQENSFLYLSTNSPVHNRGDVVYTNEVWVPGQPIRLVRNMHLFLFQHHGSTDLLFDLKSLLWVLTRQVLLSKNIEDTWDVNFWIDGGHFLLSDRWLRPEDEVVELQEMPGLTETESLVGHLAEAIGNFVFWQGILLDQSK